MENAHDGLPASDFVDAGYARLEGFLEAAEAAELEREVERLLRSPHDPSCARPHNTLVPLRSPDTIVRTVLASGERADLLRELVAAEDLRWISGYVSVKEPHSPPLWWHQDWWCWDHPVSLRREAAQVALLCYVTPTDERNGALRVLPGSHHRATELHALLPEAHARSALGARETHPAMRDHRAQVTLTARAGDAAVIDYRLLHGTHANATAVRRDRILLTFTPSWRGLPPDVQGHLIGHPALPRADEQVPAWARDLLPRFDGPRQDLPLNRIAPSQFSIGG